jgi:hypothetical protein
MRRRLIFIGMVVLACASFAGAAVDYEMEVALDPVLHRLEGTQWVRWTNTTGVPTAELWWHLYLNAFANDRTTFMRGLGSGSLRGLGPVERDWGWIRWTRLTLADGTDLLPEVEFVRPDDGNPNDFTVARVPLPIEVPPGAAVEIEASFEAKLPRILARTGYAGDFHMIGQWFPKLGVFEGGRGWNCHQFHTTSEFFADFGSYRVTIELPAEWVVAATGIEIGRDEAPRDPEAGVRVVFRAERVHDFAWCAAPASLMAVVDADFEPGRDVPMAWLERSSRLLGLSAAELELAPLKLRLMVPHSQRVLTERMLRAARLGLAWFGLNYGPYPYPQLTVVSPPSSAAEAGGMEYPTFITTGALPLLATAPMRWLPWIEEVTVHEIGHQYFQGLLASNEFEQAWLDEGLTTYNEHSCLEAMVADDLAPDLLWGGFWARQRAIQSLIRAPVTIDRKAWEYRNPVEWYAASFSKTSLALRTLEGLLGEEVFARALREYFDRYRYRHPAGDDLFDVFSEVAGEDLGWFFEQAFRSDATVDWAVLGVRHHPADENEGFGWDGSGWRREARDEGTEGSESRVITVEIGRRGEFVGPVEVELVYDDGSSERRGWDGRDRWVRWRLETDRRLSRVAVDPDGVWFLETRRRDNYWAETPRARVAMRKLWWLWDGLQLLSLAHLPWS